MRAGRARTRDFARRLRSEMTEAEVVLWTFLRRRALGGYKFRRQHPIGQYVADFACVAERLVVEIDGATHWTAEEVAHDARRTSYMESHGWRVVRMTNLDVFENVDGVWRTIECALRPPPTAAPSPPPHAGEETGAP